VFQAVLKIQSYCRRFLAVKQTRRLGALCIQKVYRGFTCRKLVKFIRRENAAIIVQKYYRRYIQGKEFPQKLILFRHLRLRIKSALVVQCAFRCLVARKRQRYLRRRRLRREFDTKLKSSAQKGIDLQRRKSLANTGKFVGPGLKNVPEHLQDAFRQPQRALAFIVPQRSRALTFVVPPTSQKESLPKIKVRDSFVNTSPKNSRKSLSTTAPVASLFASAPPPAVSWDENPDPVFSETVLSPSQYENR
jgi:IQ calmodulin-binding motif